jgi:quinol monooxygenase YgiN
MEEERMAEQLIVVAEMKAKAGMEAELKRQALGMIAPTRKEEGCVLYDLHESDTEPGRCLFYEIWASRPAWEAHMKQPHLLAFLGGLDAILAEPARVATFAKIA